jgi:pimeloyl-ACP methyl ester carboxylesterase
MRLTPPLIGLLFGCALLGGAAPSGAMAQVTPLGPNLERFDYPFPVHWYETSYGGAPLRMAYMDVAPTGPAKGVTVVLLHGKNFCGATWEANARALAAHGYRVIVPDQVGFCKSSKPEGYQYSFRAMAALTKGLLDQAKAGKVVLVGHSTGGILAVRFALTYPQSLSRLVLVNPLGLNDTLTEGVPYTPLNALRGEEAKTDAASIKAYQLRNYYHDQWRPEYDRWVAMLAGQYQDDGGVVRDAQARLSDMIETQPVTAEFGRVTTPVSLIIGQLDRTAFRSNTAPADLRTKVRTVPQAAEEAVRRFANGRIVRMTGVGHAPQVENAAAFDAALLAEIER